jgi:hypothetical protein
MEIIHSNEYLLYAKEKLNLPGSMTSDYTLYIICNVTRYSQPIPYAVCTNVRFRKLRMRP